MIKIKKNEEMLLLLSSRDECLKNGLMHHVFLYESIILKYLNTHPVSAMSSSMPDHMQILEYIMQDIVKLEYQEGLGKYLCCDILKAFEKNKTYFKLDNHYLKYIQYTRFDTDIFSIYGLAVKAAYSGMKHIDIPKNVIHNFMSIFKQRYGNNSFLNAKYTLHLITEFILDNDREYAYELFNLNKNLFDMFLTSDVFYWESYIFFANSFASIKPDNTCVILKNMEQLLSKKNSTPFKDYFNAKILLSWGYLFEKKGEIKRSIELYSDSFSAFKKLLENFEPTADKNKPNLAINCIMVGSCLIRCLYRYNLSDEAVKICNECIELNVRYKQDKNYFYYEILHLKGTMLMSLDRNASADSLAEVVFTGQKYIGKENEVYILSLLNLNMIGRNIRDHKAVLDEAASLSEKISDPGCLANVYNQKSILGMYTTDLYEAERYARTAIDYCEMQVYKDNLFTYQCNLLKILLQQLRYRPSLIDEIQDLYKSLKKDLANVHNERFLQNFIICEGAYLYYSGDVDKAILKISSMLELDSISPIDKCNLGIELIKIYYKENKINDAYVVLDKILDMLLDDIKNIIDTDLHNPLLIEQFIDFYISFCIKATGGKAADVYYHLITIAKTIRAKLLRIRNSSESGNAGSMALYRRLAAYEARLALKNALTNSEKNRIQKEVDKIHKQLTVESFKPRDISFLMNSVKCNLPKHSILIDTYTYIDYDDLTPFGSNTEISLGQYKTAMLINTSNSNSEILHYDHPYKILCLDQYAGLIDDLLLEIEKGNEAISQRKSLYNLFIKPIENILKDGMTLFISPTSMLAHIPFDVLLDNELRLLGDRFTVIYLDACVNMISDLTVDFKRSESLFIGNPHYGWSYKNKIESLPFSELEVLKIAEIVNNSQVYVQRDATKNKLLKKLNHPIIHISSHGMINDDLDELSEIKTKLVGSHIALAGYAEWLESGTSADNSNGMITADEITYMDFSKVDLVILSACDSAIGMYFDLGIPRGLRWALYIAGVGASITVLWSIDDCSTAIFMTLLYRKLLSLPIGEALSSTKRQFRNLTIKEIVSDKDLCEIYAYKERDLRKKPFQDMKYWAGFVYYLGNK